jgi:hypothetical protein
MKISPKVLHIPPYISTSWDNIRALFLKDSTLVLSLKEGGQVSIPGLDAAALNAIFSAHAEFLEAQNHHKEQAHAPVPHQQFEPPHSASIQFAIGNMDALGSALQHNPAQANMPELPQEILSKISAIAKIVAPEEIPNMPKPVPHCNCMHCQIARAIHQQFEQQQGAQQLSEELVKEEDVQDEELKFQDWEIQPNGDKLYTVINKLNPVEKYQVYLGKPFGCTCGAPNCEHLLAVLKS